MEIVPAEIYENDEGVERTRHSIFWGLDFLITPCGLRKVAGLWSDF